jgi:formiminotetrahydrofolate cyclodeaminase
LPFLQKLAQPRPDPGGGAAAAHGVALALALMEKVARLEQKRGHPPGPVGPFWDDLVAQVRRLSGEVARLQEADVRAYFRLTRARAAGEAPKLRAAVTEAVACPRRIMTAVRPALAMLLQIGEHCQKHLVADLSVACEFLGAALRGAYHIACANLPLMADAPVRRSQARELARELKESGALAQQVKLGLKARGHVNPPGGG